MPYLPLEKRTDPTVLTAPVTPGELNYAVTRLCERYRAEKGDSYGTFNDIIGALTCASLEYYRRVAGDYEDLKRETNGDVYRPVSPPRPAVGFRGGADDQSTGAA